MDTTLDELETILNDAAHDAIVWLEVLRDYAETDEVKP
jgi:hypothetical protein